MHHLWLAEAPEMAQEGRHGFGNECPARKGQGLQEFGFVVKLDFKSYVSML